ncbi:signal peptidase II [Mesorhizobium sp. SB112]|uniref:signal peptidase II n=1 Tax=Mesorhizobium sp. SB112 TaxID=3151853 RepID=UPI003266AA10
MKFKSLFAYLILIAAAVGLDQWIKFLVETHLVMHEKVDVVPFLALYRTFNTGVAFSMFSSVGDKGLVIVSVLVIAFVLYLASQTAPRQILSRIGFSLVIGGALGNLIDRSTYGHVVDYILFHTSTWSFAVFNLADVFISIGAGLVVLDELLGWLRERAAKKQSPTE